MPFIRLKLFNPHTNRPCDVRLSINKPRPRNNCCNYQTDYVFLLFLLTVSWRKYINVINKKSPHCAGFSQHLRYLFSSARLSQVCTTVSGFRERLSIPSSISQAAKSS